MSRGRPRAGLKMVFALLSSVALPIQAARSQVADHALAQRFRPYLKTTLSGGQDEPYHPADWQWIVSRSNLFHGSTTIVVPYTQLALDKLSLVDPKLNANWMVNNAGMSDPDLGLGLAGADATAGEPWNDVIGGGHGFYAHLEHIPGTGDPGQINMEYTIVWPRNAAIGSDHDGDLTTAIAVYDSASDKIIRVIYSIHGCVLSVLQVAKPTSVTFALLDGRDSTMASQKTRVLQVNVSDADMETDGSGKCAGVIEGDENMFFAEDPDTHLFEHPVLFAENSSHELWPNSSGWLSTVPAHEGDGVSFLPTQAQVLGTIDHPNPVHFPFIFYNGKFGDDPEAIVLHKSWFWPQGRDNNGFINPDRFSDGDPYQTLGALTWPPVSGLAASGEAFVRPQSGSEIGVSSNGSSTSPFAGLPEGYSVTPAGWTLRLAPGVYPGPITLGRRMILTAEAGPATLGGK